jgi:hypothetical protein
MLYNKIDFKILLSRRLSALLTKLSKTQRISIIILLILIVITMAVFSAVQMLKNTREFMNLFTFVFSNLALILFSFTIIALALIAFFWSLTNSDQKKSKAYNINDLLVKTGSLIFENSNCIRPLFCIPAGMGHKKRKIHYPCKQKPSQRKG